MKRKFFGFAVGMLMAVTPLAAQAAIEASSFLDIQNFRIINVATGAPVTVGVGADVLLVGPPTSGSTAQATLNGLATPTHVAGSNDVLAAFSDGTTIVTPGGVENNFLPRPLGISPPYARGDTNGSGTIATILPGPVTTGANAETISDVLIPNSPLPTFSGSSSSTESTTAIVLRIASAISITLNFDALLDLTLDYSLPPSLLRLTGSTSFDAAILGTGISGSGATPTGFSLRDNTTLVNMLNTGLVARTSPGITGGHNGTLFSGIVSPVLTLAPGTYIFNLTQGATAEITNVPELSSLLTWSVIVTLASAALVVGRRRTQGAAC